jgi:hypothetical protein
LQYISLTHYFFSIQWCETHKDCERLRLMDLLVKPMQRLTKYSLLLKAILKKTDSEEQKLALKHMVSVNTVKPVYSEVGYNSPHRFHRSHRFLYKLIGYNENSLLADLFVINGFNCVSKYFIINYVSFLYPIYWLTHFPIESFSYPSYF